MGGEELYRKVEDLEQLVRKLRDEQERIRGDIDRLLDGQRKLQAGMDKVLAAVETFDQTTGAIIRTIAKTQSRDDFLTLGVVGNSVGLVEREHVVGLFSVIRTFSVLNPLSRNKITGAWTPPVGTDHLVSEVSRNQGTANVAIFAEDISSNFRPTVLVRMSPRTPSARSSPSLIRTSFQGAILR